MDGQSFKDVLMGEAQESESVSFQPSWNNLNIILLTTLRQETSQFLVEYFGEGGEKCMGAYPFYHGK